MQSGLTIVELAQRVQAKAESNRDFVLDTRDMSMNEDASLKLVLPDVNSVVVGVAGERTIPVTEHAHDQIGARLKIPAVYYDRMRKDHPALLAQNVNHLFRAEPERRMVRTGEGGVRAFLSDRYRRLDDIQVMRDAVLPILGESEDLTVVSSQVTEKRLYLKVASRTVKGEIKVGDEVMAGFILSNSEIGMGALSVAPFITRLVCMNGAKVDTLGKRKLHVGRQVEEDGELFSDQTLKADDHAFMLKVRDMVRLAVDQKQFDIVVNRMKDSMAVTLPHEKPADAIVELGKIGMLREGEVDLVAQILLMNAHRDGLSQFGVAQAITQVAGTDAVSYDRSTELESLGGTILLMQGRDFERIVRAA